jgi:hypothetical protein
MTTLRLWVTTARIHAARPRAACTSNPWEASMRSALSPDPKKALTFCLALLVACKASPPAASSEPQKAAAAAPGSTAPATPAPATPTAIAPAPAEKPAAPPSSIIDKAAPKSFENLMPDAKLTGFRRVPLDPLADKPVWRLEKGILIIDGVGAKEMLLSEREFGDGVLRVEWRFLQGEGASPVYNGGVYVRTPFDGTSWVQLQVAHTDKPPVVGDLIAQVPASTERVNVFQAGPSPAKPIGEWNTYEVSALGKAIELTVNGQLTVVWPDCPMPTGHVGLQAEGAVVEVRKLEFGAF